MSTEAFQARARKHWTIWLPQRVADLKARGLFQEALRVAAIQAQEEKARLMASGYPSHAADEVVLKQFILLDPEPDADADEELDAELAEKERAYQEMMREPPENPQD
ncbi:hypothetical protein [uncultured Thiodictyon sp.]|jgi:hypothetical protein|uniref:hypothetical protein n=1 Tax=uncultured Thiodictyon sp. TaxID=1846217 RepID=UPI0025DB1B75|nr:hypothetical protein [uncultured Thiodictyon sp.]